MGTIIIGEYKVEYTYSDDTLLHSVGFNFQRLESILKYGILSKNKAGELNVTYSKNYDHKSNLDDYISLVHVGSVLNNTEEVGAYQIHSSYGINFIVEDTDFIAKRDDNNIHHQDEVVVRDAVSLEKITGLAIPREYLEMGVDKVQIIPPDITSYQNLMTIITEYINYLKGYNYHIDESLIVDYLREIVLIHQAIRSLGITDVEDRKELIEDYKEVLRELNAILGEATYICFSKILGCKVTIRNLVEYLSKGLYPIYDIPFNVLDTLKKR